MPSTSARSLSRLGVFVLFAASVVLVADVRAADSIALTVKKGPGAWPVSGVSGDGICGGGTAVTAVIRQTATTCAVWQFSRTAAGYVKLNTANNTCLCPATTDPVWY